MEKVLERFENILIKHKNDRRIQFTYNYHIETNFKMIKHEVFDNIIEKCLGKTVTGYGISENTGNGRVHISINQTFSNRRARC